mmetsp:Transcript_48482/g.80359  ORF Transcript_48482/g.80359 Transcript_48482/m.80359 type:complete len:219 (-) Transcript_48482:304-960(-)
MSERLRKRRRTVTVGARNGNGHRWFAFAFACVGVAIAMTIIHGGSCLPPFLLLLLLLVLMCLCHRLHFCISCSLFLFLFFAAFLGFAVLCTMRMCMCLRMRMLLHHVHLCDMVIARLMAGSARRIRRMCVGHRNGVGVLRRMIVGNKARHKLVRCRVAIVVDVIIIIGLRRTLVKHIHFELGGRLWNGNLMKIKRSARLTHIVHDMRSYIERGTRLIA